MYIGGKSKGALRGILIIIGLLIPCLVAGCRSTLVGTDMSVYGNWGFLASVKYDWTSYYNEFAGWHPIGYLLITWIVGHLTQNWIMYFGVIQALSIVPTYIAINKFSPNCIWLGIAAYLLIVFPLSLNAMKQMIAASFVLLASVEAKNQNPIKFLIIILVAASFHTTALIAIVLYPLIKMMVNQDNTKAFFGRYQTMSLIALAVAMAMCFYVLLPIVLPYATMIQQTYSYAIEHVKAGASNTSSVVLFLVCAMFQIIASRRVDDCQSLEHQKQSSVLTALLLILFLGCILMQFDSVATSVGRLGWYGLSFVSIWLTVYWDTLGKQLGVFNLLLLSAFVVYSYYVYVIAGSGQIYPYQSMILGIVAS